MFDQNDQSAQTNTQNQTTAGLNTTVPDITDPNMTVPSAPAAPSAGVPDLTNNDNSTIDDSNAALVDTPEQAPVTSAGVPDLNPSIDSTQPSIDPIADFSTNQNDSVNNQIDATPNEISPTTTNTNASSSDNDLLDIKKNALENLTPLLEHLDQAPEDKFRTTMMLIQASDDKSLIQVAYQAAQQITDEKEKAQALLDIVNEINYFTQSSEDKAE